MKYSAIILAAGSSKRTGLNFNKVMLEINGKRVINYSLNFFQTDPNCVEIILVVSRRDFPSFDQLFKNEKIKLVIGGSSRQASVFNALQIAVSDYILVHDGARPFILLSSIVDICTNLEKYSSITLGVKVKDTIQETLGNRVVKTFDRSTLIITQTPQGFKKDILIKAHELAVSNGFEGTDDTVLVEKFLNIKAFIVQGDYRNIKLTTKDDIDLLEVILK